jgi:hypothetical protein
MLRTSNEVVAHSKLKSTTMCLESTTEAKELFTNFAQGKLNELNDTKASYKTSRDVLVRLDSNLDSISKSIATIYNPHNMDSFVQEMDATLQQKLAKL